MTCARMEKFYVLDGPERACGLRYDLVRKEVMVCGPVVNLAVIEDVASAFGPVAGRTTPAVNKVRLVVVGLSARAWRDRLERLTDKYDLQITGSFRRACR